jgi:transposase
VEVNIMGNSKQKRFTDEFKAEAVKLALEADQTQQQTASDLGIATGTLGRWISEHRSARPDQPYSDDVYKELARVKKENKILRQERDILKKATALFAKTSR